VCFKESVLIPRSRLSFAPVAVAHIMPSLNESASMCDCALIDRVGRHETSMRRCPSEATRRLAA
jgi:hypothetical protein